jgi:hypothetical protein
MMDEQAWRLDELREEARYRRERLELYRARTYGGRAGSESRLREYAGLGRRLGASSPSRSAARKQLRGEAGRPLVPNVLLPQCEAAATGWRDRVSLRANLNSPPMVGGRSRIHLDAALCLLVASASSLLGLSIAPAECPRERWKIGSAFTGQARAR